MKNAVKKVEKSEAKAEAVYAGEVVEDKTNQKISRKK